MVVHRNNFDALRLIAASSVVVFHSYVLLGKVAQEPLHARGFVDLGTLGVAVFFVISGYLVTGSYQRDPRLISFLTKRLLRILPGLLVVLFATAFLLGPLVTTLPLKDYFASPQTWLYPLRNVFLYTVTYALPGVFEALPHPNAVNGSLWSLWVEFTCYLLVAAVGASGLLTLRGVATSFALSLVTFSAVSTRQASLPPLLYLFVQYWILFQGGMIAAMLPVTVFRASWRIWLGAAVLFVLAVIAPAFPFGTVLSAAVLTVPVMVFALNPVRGVAQAGRFGDFSYGLYIWAFPIQQVLVGRLGTAIDPALFSLVSLAATLPFAAASWWFVEKRALAWKNITSRRTEPEPATA